jgi:hypothetical protein
MNRKVLIIDTSILCCYLRVPDKETCGPASNRWDYQRVSATIDQAISEGTILVLPLATVIETGNHIARTSNCFERAVHLISLFRSGLEAKKPWATFILDDDRLRELCEKWPSLAARGLSMGDTMIIAVAEYYAQAQVHVEILTGDQGLKAYQPAAPPLVPRRRR